MNNSYLFSHRHRTWSSITFIISFMFLVLSLFLEWNPEFLEFKVFSISGGDAFFAKQIGSMMTINNILDEILAIIAILSGLVWAFSKEQVEDEFISTIRKDALVLAIYINYGVYLLATLFVYGFAFLNVLMLNVFTTLIFFIVIFNCKKRLLNNANHEE